MFTWIGEHIEMDRDGRRVRRDGEEVHLTGLEWGLLAYLVGHANHVCEREDILDAVWGTRFHYDTGTIDVHLNALRRKLGWGTDSPIETIRGKGLLFRMEQQVPRYTVDLQAFLQEWLVGHEVEIRSAGLEPQLRLTPFVNEITIAPEALQGILDGVLHAVLPGVHARERRSKGRTRPLLRLSSKLTMQDFVLSLDIDGTINELRIPIYGDFQQS